MIVLITVSSAVIAPMALAAARPTRYTPPVRRREGGWPPDTDRSCKLSRHKDTGDRARGTSDERIEGENQKMEPSL